MKVKGGLTVITLDQGMMALFADLALTIDEGDRLHLRGKPIQVIRQSLAQTAAMVTQAAAGGDTVNDTAPVGGDNGDA